MPDPPRIRVLPDALGVGAVRYHSTPADGAASAAGTMARRSPHPEHPRQQAQAYFSAAHKTLLALLCGLAVLVVLSAVTRPARRAALSFVSGSYRPRLPAGGAIPLAVWQNR